MMLFPLSVVTQLMQLVKKKKYAAVSVKQVVINL